MRLAVVASLTDHGSTRDVAGESIAGALWFFAQTLVIKVSGVAAQVALAWLLVPRDFGLIGLALSVTAFADVLYQNGLAQVLVQRRYDLARGGASAFWLSLAMSTVAGVLLVVAAPGIATLLDAPGIVPLIVVLALAVPLNGLSVVPRAHLIGDLRFRRIATISGAQVVVQNASSVVFAWLGLGALSFALALPVSALVALAMYARSRPLGASWPPRRSDWRPLSRDTAALMATSWLSKVVQFGDYFILGLFASPAAVGLYFFAFRLSAQSADIVSGNVGRVLFPAFVQLPSGSSRQHRAFTRSVRVLAGFGMPFAVLFVAFGPDVLATLFDEQWEEAAPYLRILSLAAAVRTVTGSHSHLLRAQGRYRELLRWNIVGSAAFLLLVTAGGAIAGPAGVTAAVVGHAVVDGWARYTLTVRPFGASATEILRLFAGPALAAGTAWGSSLALMEQVVGWEEPSLGRLVVGAAVAIAAYVPLLWLFARRTADEVKAVVHHVWCGFRARTAAHA